MMTSRGDLAMIKIFMVVAAVDKNIEVAIISLDMDIDSSDGGNDGHKC